jgi:radical SAM superfamily enzyme YgiQ (UPF0313 family)
MTSPAAVVGLVQVGELIWERRAPRQFQLVDGALRPKSVPASAVSASLAYLPHSVSLLQSYAKGHASRPDLYEFLLPLYRQLPIAEAAGHLGDADVVGFSAYVWNVRYSLALARALKRRRPDIIVVMGGPQVPDQAEAFLRANPCVDLVCHGEGERTFLEVLERHRAKDWDGIQSTSYLTADGRFRRNPMRPRMTQLDQIPSPMLDGTYEALMRSAPGERWLATWETNRGCPFECAFCDWGSATASKVFRYGDQRLFDEIEWMAEHDIHHLCVCDANFGILPRDVEIARRVAEAYARRGSPLAISVQNTKNRTDRSELIQKEFRRSRVVSFGASLSLQSVDPDVLKAIHRDNISLKAFDNLQKHYAAEGLETYTDLIIGLPGETYHSFVEGVSRVIQNGQRNRIAFYECFVLPNALLGQPEYRARYRIETVPVRITHFHEPIRRSIGKVAEYIDMVTSTASMSRDEWIRARVFAYLVDLVFFDRLLHVPLLLLGSVFHLDYRAMLEAFADNRGAFPTVAHVLRIFEEHARNLSHGGPQYIASEERLGLYWPADQFALIELAEGRLLDSFYEEAGHILVGCSQAAAADCEPALIRDAIELNRAMLALPFLLTDDLVETDYPVAQAYQAILAGRTPDLMPGKSRCRVKRSHTVWMSWTDWCEDLIRRLFLPRNYLYPIAPVAEAARGAYEPAGSAANSRGSGEWYA